MDYNKIRNILQKHRNYDVELKIKIATRSKDYSDLNYEDMVTRLREEFKLSRRIITKHLRDYNAEVKPILDKKSIWK